MKPADMVRETPYVKSGDDVPNIGSNQQFETAIKPLNNPNDISEPMQIKGGFAVAMLVDKKEPRIPEFDEVKARLASIENRHKVLDQKDANKPSLRRTSASSDKTGDSKSDDDRPTLKRRDDSSN